MNKDAGPRGIHPRRSRFSDYREIGGSFLSLFIRLSFIKQYALWSSHIVKLVLAGMDVKTVWNAEEPKEHLGWVSCSEREVFPPGSSQRWKSEIKYEHLIRHSKEKNPHSPVGSLVQRHIWAEMARLCHQWCLKRHSWTLCEKDATWEWVLQKNVAPIWTLYGRPVCPRPELSTGTL